MSDSAYPVVQNSTLAVISLIAGIGSWFIFPIVGAIVAIILGHMARREIKESNGNLSGARLALAGLILGYSNFVIAVLAICLVLAIFLGIIPLFFFINDTSVLLNLFV